MNELPVDRDKRVAPQPETLPETSHHRLPAKESSTAESNTVFTALINGILERTALPDGERRRRLESYFLNNLEDATLSLGTIAKVRHFARDLDQEILEKLAATLSTDEMSELLHLLYVSVCAEMGPIAADRIFSEAMEATESLPQASRFPARRLF